MPRFPAAFRPPALLLGPSFARPEIRPPYDRPSAQPRRAPTGYHVPHTRDLTGLGALSTPGPAVPSEPGDDPRPGACRPSRRGSYHPGTAVTHPGAASYEASVKGSRFSPARPSPHPWPPDDSGNPPAFPRAPHPRGHDPRTHAGAGTDSEHKPGTTPPALRHAGPPISEAHSLHVRPRVALIIWHLLKNPAARYTELGHGYFASLQDPNAKPGGSSPGSRPSGTPSPSTQPPDTQPPRPGHDITGRVRCRLPGWGPFTYQTLPGLLSRAWNLSPGASCYRAELGRGPALVGSEECGAGVAELSPGEGNGPFRPLRILA